MSDKPKIHLDLPTGVQATDITQVFTSKPYPVIVIDATTARGSIRSALLWEGNVEATAPEATITGLELRAILQSYEGEAEATAPNLAEITGLELKTVLKSTTIEDEATAPTADLTSITLESKLVSTTVEPEATAPTGTITGLELS